MTFNLDAPPLIQFIVNKIIIPTRNYGNIFKLCVRADLIYNDEGVLSDFLFTLYGKKYALLQILL